MAEHQAQRRRQASAAGGTTRGSARDRLLAANSSNPSAMTQDYGSVLLIRQLF